MKNIYLILLFSLLAISVASQTPVPPGPVSGCWSIGGSPYIINGQIHVPQDSSLIIEPGVQVKFNGWFKFIVYGSLNAIGEESDSITFTAADTNNRWHGIRFMNSNDNSILEYCIVEYGLTTLDTNSASDNGGGGIRCISCTGDIEIRHCLINNNIAVYGGGIQVTNSEPIIENCYIVNNTAHGSGGAIEVWNHCNPTIRGSILSYNNAIIGHGGGIQLYDTCNAVIDRCIITYNSCIKNGGGIQFNACPNVQITNNIIAFNLSDSIGGGMNISNTNGVFKSNTIVYNTTPHGNGGGIHFKLGSNPQFVNSIIFGNAAYSPAGGNQVYLEHKNCDPDFIYCDLEGGTGGMAGTGSGDRYHGDTTGLIDADPLFTAPMSGDFSLSWTSFPYSDTTRSPCIDRGHPDSLYLDPDGTISDMGKYYFDQTPQTPELFPATNVTTSSFEACWSQCYGAYAYYLDVALDEEFLNLVYDHIEVPVDTTYTVESLENTTTYYYRVCSYNSSLTSNYSDTQSVSTLGVLIDEKYISDKITVFPNPFNSLTTLCYELKKPENVQITIYNVQGKIICLIVEKQDKGEQHVRWNADGQPEGMYYFSVQAGDMIRSGKMIVFH